VGEGSITTGIATTIETEIKTVIAISEVTIVMTVVATLITIAADGTGTDMIATDMTVTDTIVTAASEIETTIVSTNVETGTTITVVKPLQPVGGACMSCSAFYFFVQSFLGRHFHTSQHNPTELYKTKPQPGRQTCSRSVLTYKSRKSGAKTWTVFQV